MSDEKRIQLKNRGIQLHSSFKMKEEAAEEKQILEMLSNYMIFL